MKNILILFMIFTAFKVNAQTSVYHPFPDSNAVWTIHGSGCCQSYCPGPPDPNPVVDDYSFSCFLEGDTIVAGQVYVKLYKSGMIHHHCAIGNYLDWWDNISKTYLGAYRQDVAMKKVWFLHPGQSQECLWYKLNLQVGDTVGNGGECIYPGSDAVISSIDSVQAGNDYRKRFHISNTGFSLIEGIGNTCGLFGPVYFLEYSENLVCFAQNGIPIFPDTATQCNIVTTISKEPVREETFTLYPNPFTNLTCLQTGVEFLQAELCFYNTMGQEVKHQTLHDLTTYIDRSKLVNGLYFIKILSPTGKILTGKLIVQ